MSPHEHETDLEDRVFDLFVDHYGREQVVRQHIYPTDRRVDILVDAGAIDLAVECESRASNVVDGVGQAILYENHAPRGRAVGMVVIADGHSIEDPERAYLEQEVPVFEESELRTALAER